MKFALPIAYRLPRRSESARKARHTMILALTALAMARLRRGMLMDYLVAAIIFGIAAVWAVPYVSAGLQAVLPASFKATIQPYLPSGTAPGFTLQAAGNAVVFGALLALVLILLRKVGVKRHIDGVEA